MKKIKFLSVMKYGCLLMPALIVSCKNNNSRLSPSETTLVKDSVSRTAMNISRDVTGKGPVAWLNYFENDPGFFMASDGQLAFKDFPSAKKFTLNFLVKNFSKITLGWKNMQVDPLSATYASFGADFHEDIVLSNGNTLSVGGYCTATFHFDGNTWKIRDMNWAIKAPDKTAH